MTIAEADQGATLKLEHTVPDNEHWRTYGPAAAGAGWDDTFLALALLLDGDPRATPEEMAKLSATQEGDEFLTGATDAWKNAHVAAGANAEAATQAARRTTDAYRSHQ